MNTIWLAVAFVAQGELVILDGYHPRPQPDMETCEARAEVLRETLKATPGLPPVHGVYCGTQAQIKREALE